MKRTEAEALARKEKNRKIKETVKSIFFGACAIFTVISLLILSTKLTAENNFVEPTRFFMIFPFALCVSLANTVFKAKSLNVFIKIIIHYAATVFAFYVFMCSQAQRSKILALIALFGIAYIIVAAIALTTMNIIKKKTEAKPTYTSMFGDASKKQ